MVKEEEGLGFRQLSGSEGQTPLYPNLVKGLRSKAGHKSGPKKGEARQPGPKKRVTSLFVRRLSGNVTLTRKKIRQTSFRGY